MNEAAVLWCLAHQSNFFKSTFTSLIKTTLGGIQQQFREPAGLHIHPDSGVWIGIEVLILFPLSNMQEFLFLNFPNILFLFEAYNSYICTMYVYTYMDTRVYVYKYRYMYMTIYAWRLTSQFVKVQPTIQDINTQALTLKCSLNLGLLTFCNQTCRFFLFS